MKRLRTSLVALMLAATAFNSTAATPPNYLTIKEFRVCLATQEIKTYQAWCMPAEKPAPCPAASWAQLKALDGNDKLPDCPPDPTVATAVR